MVGKMGLQLVRLIVTLALIRSAARSTDAISIPEGSLARRDVFVRGGSSPIEPNPNYPHETPPFTTLGQLEDDGYQLQKKSAGSHYTYQDNLSGKSRRPRPLSEVVVEFFLSLRKLSPTLYYLSLSVIATFLFWQLQMPQLVRMLQNHFICSRHNVIRHGRVHAVFLSAISHASLVHMLLNLYGLLTFGPSVRKSIARAGLPLWPFVFGACLSSSAVFLALCPQGACFGLSGVTLALLAFYARANPSNILGFMVGFIPIRMPAEYALTGILVMSLFGVLTKGSRDGVAHATHLGGLIFGVTYFELFVRGWLTSNRPWFFRWNNLNLLSTKS
uniref:Peptidase S54 rhomboid domain-containing protein n=1 Tax=Odontella aurita TaxID=265563 RepID=A0A7S4M9N3_9STRA|mmetsp:Transcript_14930/g.43490  ORF Transcript_14930/g.43490 Transcript_14930/m.43490 type:complete len:331 (+) Transcript_14930:201-1193(+)